jgi:hypothetical protein
MWINPDYKINKKAHIVSSCYARQCHPETCCCGDDEYFLQQEVEYLNYLGMVSCYHFDNVAYGTKKELEDYMESLK